MLCVFSLWQGDDGAPGLQGFSGPQGQPGAKGKIFDHSITVGRILIYYMLTSCFLAISNALYIYVIEVRKVTLIHHLGSLEPKVLLESLDIQVRTYDMTY